MRKITTYSFYEWDLMNEKEREEKSHIIELLLLDYIHLNDFFLVWVMKFQTKVLMKINY